MDTSEKRKMDKVAEDKQFTQDQENTLHLESWRKCDGTSSPLFYSIQGVSPAPMGFCDRDTEQYYRVRYEDGTMGELPESLIMYDPVVSNEEIERHSLFSSVSNNNK